MSLAHAALTHPLSVAQFLALWEEGALGTNHRIELIEGEVREMTPIGPQHSGSTTDLVAALVFAVGKGRAVVRCQVPMDLSALTLLQPDVALCLPGDYYRRHPTAKEALLVIEVADTSEASDRRDKLPLYAAASIPELWLVLPAKRIVEIHRDPDPAAKTHRSVTIAKPGDSIAPLAFPDAKIAVADFLPPEG
jgi:Uma2 family endonuclease